MVNEVKRILKNTFGTNLTVRKSKLSGNSEEMNKLLFIEVIKVLRQIVKDSDTLQDLGIDISGMESSYYVAITNLLRMNFTDPQVEIISYYVYEMPSDDEEFEGKMQVTEKNKVKTYTFKTPEDLWDILKLVK